MVGVLSDAHRAWQLLYYATHRICRCSALSHRWQQETKDADAKPAGSKKPGSEKLGPAEGESQTPSLSGGAEAASKGEKRQDEGDFKVDKGSKEMEAGRSRYLQRAATVGAEMGGMDHGGGGASSLRGDQLRENGDGIAISSVPGRDSRRAGSGGSSSGGPRGRRVQQWLSRSMSDSPAWRGPSTAATRAEKCPFLDLSVHSLISASIP
ncbi:hypothetical protein CLOM_g13993 [Closterium sp. NIES-68]|nr:hypothetical protein CLOM_g13993 [Closterium sp. NIES-68]